MATFTTCVRSKDKEYNTVYIRIIHNGKPDYIKTTLQASKKQLKGMNVKDNVILVQANALIKEYIEKLNLIDSKYMTVQQVKEYLQKDGSEISFTDFYKEYLIEMSKEGRDNPAKNYRTALNSLKKSMSGSAMKEVLDNYNIYFKDLTIDVIRKWIKSLEKTARAKNLYPYLIKAVFDAGVEKYNDYDNGVLLIKNNPFRKGMIPDSNEAKKRAVPKEILQKIFYCDLTNIKSEIRPQLAQDVAKLIFCLAGINTVDLYEMKKHNYKDGKLKYNRHKTSEKRKDKARFEISIPDEIEYLFDKYKGKQYLFDFVEKYTDFNSFNKNVNIGLGTLIKVAGVEFNITTYTFRHSWATIAQNVFGASDELVGFCLNHASAHKETVLYIEKDFSPVDELNKKIIDYILP